MGFLFALRISAELDGETAFPVPWFRFWDGPSTVKVDDGFRSDLRRNTLFPPFIPELIHKTVGAFCPNFWIDQSRVYGIGMDMIILSVSAVKLISEEDIC